MSDVQLFLAIGIPTLAVLAGMMVNLWQVSTINARITDLRQDFNLRFEDLKDAWRAELHRVEEVLDARLRHLEEK